MLLLITNRKRGIFKNTFFEMNNFKKYKCSPKFEGLLTADWLLATLPNSVYQTPKQASPLMSAGNFFHATLQD